MNSFARETAQKAVMVIAGSNFRDEELLVPQNMLRTNRVEVVLASSSLSPAKGMLGSVVRPDMLLKDVRVEEFAAVIFVGGSGAEEFWNDPTAHLIAAQAVSQGKIVGAICIAPVILANAGVLKGKKAAAWPGVAQQLKEAGVNYSGAGVEADGNIITAAGPEHAAAFAEALVTALVRRR